MQIIDIHTHIYPDEIAQKATDSVKSFYGIGGSNMNGTESMLLNRGRKAGISKFVILPVAIRPDRVQSINNFILQRSNENPDLIPFGTVHAAMDGIVEETERLLSAGVKGINLNKDDEIVAALPVRNEKDYLAIFATNGMAKKFASSELPIQKRAGKGLICSKTELAAAALISDEDNLLICGDTNSICISAKDITIGSRPALGTIVIKDNNIISVSKV